MILNILNTYYLQRNICDNDRTAKFKDIEPGIVISNTGSSHGLYGFNYEELGEEYNCFNFALESQRLSYDYRIVSNYSDYLAENGIMFTETKGIRHNRIFSYKPYTNREMKFHFPLCAII